MSTNDTTLGILGGCETASVNEVDLSDDHKFTKLELTEGQCIQISGLMKPASCFAR